MIAKLQWAVAMWHADDAGRRPVLARAQAGRFTLCISEDLSREGWSLMTLFDDATAIHVKPYRPITAATYPDACAEAERQLRSMLIATIHQLDTGDAP
jgi:hypothetical protein